MRRRLSLGLQIFTAMLAASLVTALIVGVAARTALSSAFDAYLSSLPTPRAGMMGRGMGRVMLGAAEQTFVSRVDTSVAGGALLAVAVAALVALVLAAYLNRPLRRLEAAAEVVAEGDLSHRVEIQGPTEVAAIGEAFNRMADSLEEIEELRRKMVADVAHELRNPLAAARAQAEGMSERIIDASPERLESLVDDLRHLSTLVEDLQELAIAEAGRLRYEMARVDLAALVRAEAELSRSLVASGVSLDIDAPDTPVDVVGDERRLAQVIRNLVSNAARHTASGAIAVRVERDAAGVTVSVTDTGEGISAEDLPYIFDRFYRADAARAADTGGAGLGLAISRSIVRDHGGDVFASSAPGRGTTIGFTLPAT